MIYARFSNRRIQIHPQLLKRCFGILQTYFSHLTQAHRQFFKSIFLLQKKNVVNLPRRRCHRLGNIGSFAIDAPVYRIADFPDDPGIFKFHQRHMRLNHIQKIRNSGSFFYVNHIILFPLYNPPFDLELGQNLQNLLCLQRSAAYNFQMISFPGIAHRTGCQKRAS